MAFRVQHSKLVELRGHLHRALQYALTYNWTREMSRSRRAITWAGILIQGYAIYAGLTRSLVWPFRWPQGPSLYVIVWFLYVLGTAIVNGLLTAEFVRKTQLETDQIAARQIQESLQRPEVGSVREYEFETFYRPFRQVGGDYFDLIQLPGDRMLLVVADVSGKGTPAALLAANMQALVRTAAVADTDLVGLVTRINKHLARYTPQNRFATAVFVLLNSASGNFDYVNAGHNPAVLFSASSATLLEATGLPLGLFDGSSYVCRTSQLAPGTALLAFTDGLTDSIQATEPERRLGDTLVAAAAESDSAGKIMSKVQALVNMNLVEDDIAVVLLARGGAGRAEPVCA